MKRKIIDNFYNDELGLSYVKIRTKYGDFEGESELHEEDRDIASSFAGCQYAESKAIEKCLKQQVKELRLQVKGIQDVLSTLETMKNYNPKSVEARKMRRKIHELNKKIEDLQEQIKLLSIRRVFEMEHRREKINRLKEKKDREV